MHSMGDVCGAVRGAIISWTTIATQVLRLKTHSLQSFDLSSDGQLLIGRTAFSWKDSKSLSSTVSLGFCWD